MGCTTILVGKKASNDGSTMIARNDDGHFDVKKIVVNSKNKKKIYKSTISNLEIELPSDSLRYTSSPNVDEKNGIWAASGINEYNVAMTATETITSNSRVLGADPYVIRKKGKNKNEKDFPGGIGEEDIVELVLPYIKTAREGVYRLGELLEKYGTYEANGIAFSDKDEIWWLETIGGHHYIARRVKDDEYVIMPNQFGLDRFDFDDAYNMKKENICSNDLKEFIQKNHLSLNMDNSFNPRLAFGSHDDSDHVYNTPRAWYMAKYFNPNTYKYEGDNADFTPQSDNIPWSLRPERKITIEDMKYILSSYYQGTKYNPYSKIDYAEKGIYRPIGISRTGFMSINQIRNDVEEKLKAIEWICFGSNAFNTIIPLYTNVSKLPNYVSNVQKEITTDNFYWTSRLIAALADSHYSTCIIYIERYQKNVLSQSRGIINEYDKKISETKNYLLMEEANEKICKMLKKEADLVLSNVLYDASLHMKNNYSRSDN